MSFDIEAVIGAAKIPEQDVTFRVSPDVEVTVTLRALTAEEWDGLDDKTSRADQLGAQTVAFDGDRVDDAAAVWAKLLTVLPMGEVRAIMEVANPLAVGRVASPDFSQPDSPSRARKKSSGS